MGLSSTTNRVSFTGDGSSTIFSFPYYFFKTSDLSVYLFDTGSSIVTPQTLNTHFTISGNTNAGGVYPSGGSVVMNSAVPTSSQIIITRNPSPVQNYALLQNGPISANALVQQLDYLTALIQRLQDEVSRAVQLPDGLGTIGGSLFNTTLPQNVGLASISANAPIIVNSGATGLTFGFVIGSSGFAGTAPVVNGGTGQNLPLIPGDLWYSATATAMGQVPSVPAGQFLQSQGSSIPIWSQVTIGSGSVSNASIIGILGVPNGGTNLTSYAGGKVLTANSNAISESQVTIIASSGVGVGNGSASAPSITFNSDLKTGWYRPGALEAAFAVNGQQSFDLLFVGSSQINFGFGIAASASANTPFQGVTTFNGTANFLYGNLSQGASSGTVFLIQNGAGANYTQIENWAWLSAGYLSGGSAIFSSPNQTQFIVGVEAVSSSAFMGFTLGGRTQPTERIRFSQTALQLNAGVGAIFMGSTGQVSIRAASSVTSHGYVLPTAQGGATTNLQNDGAGNLSWVSTAAGINYSVSTKSANYNAISTDDVLLTTSSLFTINLYNAVGNSGRIINIIKTDSSIVNILSIVGTSAQTIGGLASITANTLNESWKLISDGANWQIADHFCNTGWVNYGANVMTATGGGLTKGLSLQVDRILGRRVGSNFEGRVEYLQNTAGSSGTGDYTFGVPVAIDTSIVTVFGGVIGGNTPRVANVLGTCLCTGAGTVIVLNGPVHAFNSTQLRFGSNDTTSGGGAGVGVANAANLPLNTASTTFSASFSYPVPGWLP